MFVDPRLHCTYSLVRLQASTRSFGTALQWGACGVFAQSCVGVRWKHLQSIDAAEMNSSESSQSYTEIVPGFLVVRWLPLCRATVLSALVQMRSLALQSSVTFTAGSDY